MTEIKRSVKNLFNRMLKDNETYIAEKDKLIRAYYSQQHQAA